MVGALVGGFLGGIAFGRGIGSFWSPWTWLLAFVGSVIVLADLERDLRSQGLTTRRA